MYVYQLWFRSIIWLWRLNKTLYRLNKQLCTACVLLIKQCDHEWCIQIYFKQIKLMKFTSVKEKFESWLSLTGFQCDHHWWYIKMIVILMSNIRQHFCVSWFYLHRKKKKTNQIRSRYLGVYCWPACLPHYLSWK